MAHRSAWPALKLQMAGSVGFEGCILAKQVLVAAEQVLAARAGRANSGAAVSEPHRPHAGMPLNWVQLAKTKPGEAFGARGSVAGEAHPQTVTGADWHLYSSQTWACWPVMLCITEHVMQLEGNCVCL